MLTEARHVVLPKDIASTEFPKIRETCRRIGIGFDPWQIDLNRCIGSKTSDGLYAADTVVISIPRQVGKTFDVGAIMFAQCIANPGITVVWTAHRFKVARETFNALRAIAKSPKLVPHIEYDDITTAAGNECIPFRNGSRIVFAARERGAIRGFSKVRFLILDEAQILTEAALSDLAPTMNQAENPQIILMGTPPKPTDPGEVFTNLRLDALSGVSEGVLFVEFSADPDLDFDDRAAWRQANPSFPARTSARAILRLRKVLSHDDFGREALGIWDSSALGLFDMSRWNGSCFDPQSAIDGPVRLALEVSQDRGWAVIAAAGKRADGLMHVQVVENHPGTGWVVEKIAELGDEVWLSPNSPAGSLISDIENAGVTVHQVPAGDYAKACGAFYDRYKGDGDRAFLRHIGQGELSAAVKDSRKRVSGDSWVFDRKSRDVDISPLSAVTLAAWAASIEQPSVYEQREVRFL